MKLYPHQSRVYDLLAASKNIILRAPTGSGKTQAAIYPFLASVDAQSEIWGLLPRKCIYSVPMRVLAKQFNVEYKRTVHRYNARFAVDVSTSIQTGEMPQDPELQNDLIFATIDQTLSSFLMAPYGLSRGRANLNLGAILSSYLVFDEFHLYDPDSTLPTVLQMLKLLNGITPFVLMTATFSDALVTRLAQALNAEVVGLSASDRAAFAGLKSQDKTRRYHTCEETLTPEIVLAKHKGRSVVICNTVDRARRLAQALRAAVANTDTAVILLHSQFLRADRDEIEKKIRTYFGKDAPEDGDYIIVATQAIEVGVDITSTVMHTELAPANAIIQRAGRCARYKGDTGDVNIYRHVQDQHGEIIDLYERTNPYSGALQKPQVAATFEAFRTVTGQRLTYSDEQQIIETVHGEADRQILNDLEADAAHHRSSMFTAMRGDHDQVDDLVRKVIAQPVTIHPEPQSIEQPYRLPSFSLHPGTLQGYANTWLKHFHNITDDDLAPPFAVKVLQTETDPDDSNKTLYSWGDLGWNAEKECALRIPYGTLVIVHPALASYTKIDGFLPNAGGGWASDTDLDVNETQKRPPYSYRLETYAEHIRLVWKAAFEDDRAEGRKAYWHELEWAAQRIAERLRIPADEVRRAAELTVLLHDVGKLSTGWQGWVREYQSKIGDPITPDESYAHTERQTDHHREVEKHMPRKPPHAVESAVAASIAIAELPLVLRQAVFTAISRHHGAFTSDYRPVQLERYALDKVNATLESPIHKLADGEQVKKIKVANMFVAPRLQSTATDDVMGQFFAYAILARLLRRADSKGTALGSSPKHL
jgi:CRISPR-associated endonuclease/helicase Cas3